MKKRPIQAIFYRGKKIVKINHSASPNNAVTNAFRHMQTNQYQASHVEVFNSLTGKLYAVTRWTDVGTKLDTLYKADIEEFNHDN